MKLANLVPVRKSSAFLIKYTLKNNEAVEQIDDKFATFMCLCDVGFVGVRSKFCIVSSGA